MCTAPLIHFITSNVTDNVKIKDGALSPLFVYPDSTTADESYCSTPKKHCVTPDHPDVTSAGSIVILKIDADCNIHDPPETEYGTFIHVHDHDMVAHIDYASAFHHNHEAKMKPIEEGTYHD